MFVAWPFCAHIFRTCMTSCGPISGGGDGTPLRFLTKQMLFLIFSSIGASAFCSCQCSQVPFRERNGARSMGES